MGAMPLVDLGEVSMGRDLVRGGERCELALPEVPVCGISDDSDLGTKRMYDCRGDRMSSEIGRVGVGESEVEDTRACKMVGKCSSSSGE